MSCGNLITVGGSIAGRNTRLLDQFLTGQATTIITKTPATAKFYISKAAERGVAVTVTELGAGVKRIARATRPVCPHCRGKGYI